MTKSTIYFLLNMKKVMPSMLTFLKDHELWSKSMLKTLFLVSQNTYHLNNKIYFPNNFLEKTRKALQST